jgi:uncharacterized protein YndB with AHSA1/START domain
MDFVFENLERSEPRENTLLTITFRETAEGGTDVTLVHERLASATAEDVSGGWSGALDRLEELFIAS